MKAEYNKMHTNHFMMTLLPSMYLEYSYNHASEFERQDQMGGLVQKSGGAGDYPPPSLFALLSIFLSDTPAPAKEIISTYDPHPTQIK